MVIRIYDAVVLAKFPNATSIIPLIRKKILSKTEHILEWTIMPSFGAFDIVDQVNNFGGYFLVESDEKQYTATLKMRLFRWVPHTKYWTVLFFAHTTMNYEPFIKLASELVIESENL